MRIIGAMVFWRDNPALIEIALKSLRERCDYLVAVDGKFQYYPSTASILSDKSLRKLVKEYADLVIDAPLLWQIDKRNQYLIGNEGDYYLVLDSDEELQGDISGLVYSDYSLEIRYGDKRWGVWDVYRLFQHRPGIHYDKWDNLLWIDDTVIPHPTLKKYKDAWIMHHSSRRPLERQEADARYHKIKRQFMPENLAGVARGGYPSRLQEMKKEEEEDIMKERVRLRYKGGLGPYYRSHPYIVAEGAEFNVDSVHAKGLLRDFPKSFEKIELKSIASPPPKFLPPKIDGNIEEETKPKSEPKEEVKEEKTAPAKEPEPEPIPKAETEPNLKPKPKAKPKKRAKAKKRIGKSKRKRR